VVRIHSGILRNREFVRALVLSANGTRTRNDRGARTNVRSAIRDVFACFAMRFLKIRIAVAKEI
jgi:hypothetical protein